MSITHLSQIPLRLCDTVQIYCSYFEIYCCWGIRLWCECAGKCFCQLWIRLQKHDSVFLLVNLKTEGLRKTNWRGDHTAVRVTEELEMGCCTFTLSRNLLLPAARQEMTLWAEIWFVRLQRRKRNQCGVNLKLWVIIVDGWEGWIWSSTVCWCVINTSRAGGGRVQVKTQSIWIEGKDFEEQLGINSFSCICPCHIHSV